MDSEQELRTSRVMLQTHAVSMNWEIGQEGQYKQTENIKPVAHNLYLTGDPFFQNYFSCKKKKTLQLKALVEIHAAFLFQCSIYSIYRARFLLMLILAEETH